jgi:hypothetical protein
MIAMCTKGIGVKKRLLLISAVLVLAPAMRKSPKPLPGNGEFFNEFEFDPLRAGERF